MKRAVIVLGALTGTGLMLWAVLLLGSWGYEIRRLSYHQARLQRLVERQPRLDVVTVALEEEGSPLVAAPRDEQALREAAARWGGGRRDEILQKGLHWSATRAHRAGDVTYFLYYDTSGVLKDYTCVAGP
jgi:hypothetical protein